MSGRPTIYTEALVDQICDRIANGESMRRICEAEDMPARSVVLLWLGRYEYFRAIYARAREAQADVMDDLILDVANDAVTGKTEPSAARVAILAYQWRAARLQPKVYGDRQSFQHSGPNDGPISFSGDYKAEILDLLAPQPTSELPGVGVGSSEPGATTIPKV